MQDPTPPPLPGTQVERWWVEEDGGPVGPIDRAALLERLRDGRTGRAGLVWRPGLAGWVPAESLPELAAALAGTPPPLPPRSRHAELMLGVWEARPAMPGFETVIRARYTADGRFAGSQTVRMLVGFDAPGSTQPIAGRWSVQEIDATRFLLRIDAEVAIGAGALPGASVATTVPLRVLDPLTLQREDDGALIRRVG